MSKPSSNGDHYRLSDAVVARSVGDEMLVLDLDSGIYHSLNEVGAVLYRLLADGADRNELVAAVTAEFEVDEQRAARDVEAFLVGEVESGLVRIG